MRIAKNTGYRAKWVIEAKKRLIDLEMTQTDLAEAIGIAPSRITEVFNRIPTNGRKQVKSAICEYLSIEVDDNEPTPKTA
jgi:DNA-binding Xre family transcriptional regulator